MSSDKDRLDRELEELMTDIWFRGQTGGSNDTELANAIKDVKKKLKQLIASERTKAAIEELEFLERLKLEFEANICDCGEPWKGTDAHILVKDRIAKLENK